MQESTNCLVNAAARWHVKQGPFIRSALSLIFLYVVGSREEQTPALRVHTWRPRDLRLNYVCCWHPHSLNDVRTCFSFFRVWFHLVLPVSDCRTLWRKEAICHTRASPTAANEWHRLAKNKHRPFRSSLSFALSSLTRSSWKQEDNF